MCVHYYYLKYNDYYIYIQCAKSTWIKNVYTYIVYSKYKFFRFVFVFSKQNNNFLTFFYQTKTKIK